VNNFPIDTRSAQAAILSSLRGGNDYDEDDYDEDDYDEDDYDEEPNQDDENDYDEDDYDEDDDYDEEPNQDDEDYDEDEEPEEDNYNGSGGTNGKDAIINALTKLTGGNYKKLPKTNSKFFNYF